MTDLRKQNIEASVVFKDTIYIKYNMKAMNDLLKIHKNTSQHWVRCNKHTDNFRKKCISNNYHRSCKMAQKVKRYLWNKLAT